MEAEVLAEEEDQVVEEGRQRQWVGEGVEGEYRLLVAEEAQAELRNLAEVVLSAHSSVEEVVERELKWVGEEAPRVHLSVVKVVGRVLK